MISEITKMKDFDHPNVMSLIGVCLDAGPGVSLVMPFMANGCLLNYLKKERDNLYLKDDTELDEVYNADFLSVKEMYCTDLKTLCLSLPLDFVSEKASSENVPPNS